MSGSAEYYRSDGVRITHDPFAPGMATRNGRPGETDPDGFGPGIYGGGVLRDGSGRVAIGQQYQSCNPRPGPVYDGTGYSAMSKAIRSGPTAQHWYAPRHRMASNNPEGARALLRGGAADTPAAEGSGETPLQVALESHAHAVTALLQEALKSAASAE